MASQWWHLDSNAAAGALGSDLSNGLAKQEAELRYKKYGPNQLKEKEGASPLSIFLEQFDDFIVWVLIGAGVVSGFLKEWVDALAIVAIVILNAILGFIQEYRAEKSLAALKKLSSPNSKVVRGGEHLIVSSAMLVPGDLIELEAGDNVPCDCRLVSVTPNFSTQEANLTGESNPVAKTILALEEKEIALGDRANMAYMGTFVASGKARGIAIGTGMQTELGKIAGMIGEISGVSTPLQRKLEEFGKWIVYVCFVLVGLVFALGMLRGGKLLDMFLTSVSLAVAAIPEGLPAVVTIALALGVQRMVKRNALIRKLPSVETLGSASVICSDKTGTLTKNEMTVQAYFTSGNLFTVTGVGYEPKGEFLLDGKLIKLPEYNDLRDLLNCSVLCNGSRLVREQGVYKIMGDPTEGALLTAAAKLGISKSILEEKYSFVEEIPFDSERKKMTVIYKNNAKFYVFVKGAPDILAGDCTRISRKGEIENISRQDKNNLFEVNDKLAGQAMRVLAFAYKIMDKEPDNYDAKSIENDLIFLGLAAMIDPAREEVKEAINKCKSAGIRTVMITGDHKNTAVAIAKQLGFFSEDSIAITGEELDRLSDDEFFSKVDKISVYARVSPEHKLRVVRAWKKRGDIVAMTGDGVNDAPAVKEADIGVAMGITGTDVTKEVSDMVITDDNFASIVAAVEEGRGIYDNIKKFVHYLLSCNAGEILVMFVSTLAGLPAPLLPIHILWVNLVTDGMPALALGVDPVEPGIMKRGPRPASESVVTRDRAFGMIWQGAFIAFCSLLAFCLVLFYEKEGLARARTAAFIVLACSQLFHSFNCRSATESIFKLGIFSNKNLVYAGLVSFLLQMAVVYTPFLRGVFKTEVLGVFDWCLVVGISSFPLWAMELAKLARKLESKKARD